MTENICFYNFNDGTGGSWDEATVRIERMVENKVDVILASSLYPTTLRFSFNTSKSLITPGAMDSFWGDVDKGNWLLLVLDCIKNKNKYMGLELEIYPLGTTLTPLGSGIGYIDFYVKTPEGAYLYLLTNVETNDDYTGVFIKRQIYHGEQNYNEVVSRITKDGIIINFTFSGNISGKYHIPFNEPLDVVRHAEIIHHGAKAITDDPIMLNKLTQYSHLQPVLENHGRLKPGVLSKDDHQLSLIKNYFAEEKGMGFLISFNDLTQGDLYHAVLLHRHLHRLTPGIRTAIISQFNRRFIDISNAKNSDADKLGKLLELCTRTNKEVSAIEKAFFELFDTVHPHSEYTINL